MPGHGRHDAFNDVDGIPASGNRCLLTEILREKWGFQGCVVTDYTAVSEMKNHGTAATDADAAKQSLEAGVDMDMVSEIFLNELPTLVQSGEVSQEILDAAVMRILEAKWDLGLFADPFLRGGGNISLNRELAFEAAIESIVLLKNSPALLPLAKTGSIAVVGPLAESCRDLLGCWMAAGDEKSVISPLDAIREAVGERAKITTEIRDETDVVILMLGETYEMSGEAASRTDIRLPKSQRELAREIAKSGKPCVLVTFSGRPLDLSWEEANFPSILHAWAPGIEGGRALAQMIFGDFSPVGKLTMGSREMSVSSR
ncbi:MAG: hypothetical protein HC845_14185 [Akkermansiaceae bacterium]|nr:hypothetical protein [Akkermansiaceae bacterium]